MGIPQYKDSTVDTVKISTVGIVNILSDPLLKTMAKYKNHPSVRLIKDKYF